MQGALLLDPQDLGFKQLRILLVVKAFWHRDRWRRDQLLSVWLLSPQNRARALLVEDRRVLAVSSHDLEFVREGVVREHARAKAVIFEVRRAVE